MAKDHSLFIMATDNLVILLIIIFGTCFVTGNVNRYADETANAFQFFSLRQCGILKELTMPPVIDPEKCTGCGTCAEICNSALFIFNRKEDSIPRVAFPDECWHCDSCVLDCPAGAIRLRLPLCYSLMHVDASSIHLQTGEKHQ